MTLRLHLKASRNATWNQPIKYVYFGDPLPLEGATIAVQWRQYEGQSGDPLIDLADVEFEDIAAPTDDRPTRRELWLYPVADQATLAALDTGLNEPEPGEADRFVWDAVVTYADTTSDRLVGGFVYLEPGVTVP